MCNNLETSENMIAISNLEQDIKELNDDIKHLEDVLQNWHGCDACKEDHIRLLKWLKTLLRYFEKGNNNK